MRRSLHLTIVVVFLVGLGDNALTDDRLHGTATLNMQKASFARGVAIWKGEKREVSLGFFASAPSASRSPHMVLDLTFGEGVKKAFAPAIAGCHIGFRDYKDSPLDLNGFARQCGIVDLSGDLKPGGIVSGSLKGEYVFKGFGSMPTKTATWDLSFTATLRTTGSSVEAAADLGARSVRLGPGGGAPGRAFLEQRCQFIPDLKDRMAVKKYLKQQNLLPSDEDLTELSRTKGRRVTREEAVEMTDGMLELAAAMSLSDCKVLAGRQDGSVAVIEIEATMMGERMRNDVTLVKEGQRWTVQKDDAWRSAKPTTGSKPGAAAAPK
jgi:hypothetical protein